MSTEWDAIHAAMHARRTTDAPLLKEMIAVRDRVNGDVVIPLPDVEGEPTIDPPSPRLIGDAIDSTAMRASSQPENIFTPALDDTKAEGIRSREYAAIRRRALYANWEFSALDILKFRFYRHLVGYGAGYLVVMPDHEHKRARVELRDPLTSYPEVRSPDDVREPLNIGFVFGRSRSWIRRAYKGVEGVEDLVGQEGEELWDLVEWIDPEETVIGILGPRFRTGRSYPQYAGSNGMELRRWANRSGMVPVAAPRRVTLDRIMGQVSTLIGSVDLLTRMKALAVVAAEKGVFPDMQVIGQNGRVPTLLGGRWRDGRTGEVNVILDGQAQMLTQSVGPATFQEMSTMERDIRMSSGNPGMFGGELTGSLRSGQTVNSLAGMAIDPRIQEAHAIAKRALTVVNQAILATEKGYWPDKKYVVFSGSPGQGMVEYIPSKHFETFDNVVSYPFPGMDLSQVTVSVAQLNASGLASKQTSRLSHPLISDPELEDRLVLVERLDEAYLAGLLTRLASGDPNAVTDLDFVVLRETALDSGNLAAAIKAATEAAQKRQATIAPDPEEGMIAPPEAMPGMAGPGQGAEQPMAPTNVPGLNPAQEKLSRANFLLSAGRARPSA